MNDRSDISTSLKITLVGEEFGLEMDEWLSGLFVGEKNTQECKKLQTHLSLSLLD